MADDPNICQCGHSVAFHPGCPCGCPSFKVETNPLLAALRRIAYFEPQADPIAEQMRQIARYAIAQRDNPEAAI